jgi:putative ABC transport system substrate-binding protein
LVSGFDRFELIESSPFLFKNGLGGLGPHEGFRVGIVAVEIVRGMRRYIEQTQTAAKALGVTIRVVEVRSLGDFEQAFDELAKARVEGIVLPADGLFYEGRSRLAELALRHKLPLVVYSRETLEAGALMSYGADQPTIFRRAGAFVDKIIKGARPADLPVEQPTRFELLVNLKTANTLGVTIPDTLLAQRCDRRVGTRTLLQLRATGNGT